MTKIHNRTPTHIRFWHFVDKMGPIHPIHGQCWHWTGGVHKHFQRAAMKVRGRQTAAARYSWELHNGRPPTKCILHKCDNKMCVNPNHLFEGTRIDNIMDMVAKGRQSKGELGRHKLTSDQVADIRKVYLPRSRGPFSGQALAKKYKVSLCQIVRIAKYQTRRHDGMLNKPVRQSAGAS